MRCPVQILAGTPTILSEGFYGFPPFLSDMNILGQNLKHIGDGSRESLYFLWLLVGVGAQEFSFHAHINFLLADALCQTALTEGLEVKYVSAKLIL
jgi:hypothetical protein